jgi:hypothetical protein
MKCILNSRVVGVRVLQGILLLAVPVAASLLFLSGGCIPTASDAKAGLPLDGSKTTNFVNAMSYARSCRDPDSGVIIYVESDLHHVVALDRDGKMLWCRTPATDGNLPAYSDMSPRPNPAITYIGVLRESERRSLKTTGSGQFVGIRFASRQGGYLDVKNGEFIFEGQN